MKSPIEALHNALASAIHKDLPHYEYMDRDWECWRSLSKEAQTEAIKNDTVPKIYKTRPYRDDEVDVVMFPQTWGSTALGFDGIGGAAMTTAYTMVISCSTTACVYFGGRLAYTLNLGAISSGGYEKFKKDIADQNMVEVRSVGKYL